MGARSEFEKQEKSFSMAANSTVMYSGLDPSAKSSSKVLAPPGGRSSIGFGPEEDLASKAQAEPTPEPIPEPRPEGEEPTDQIPVKPEESNEEAPAEKPAAKPAKKMPETEEYTKAMGPQRPLRTASCQDNFLLLTTASYFFCISYVFLHSVS